MANFESFMTMTASADKFYFNWSAIIEHAKMKIPTLKPQADGGNSMLSPEWQEFSTKYQSIVLCRQLLAARHEGWKEAGDLPDPIPVFPFISPKDMK